MQTIARCFSATLRCATVLLMLSNRLQLHITHQLQKGALPLSRVLHIIINLLLD